MKIAFYNITAGFKTGGLETFTWEMARAVQSLGPRVEIVGGHGGRARDPDVALTTFPYTDRHDFPNLGTRFGKLMERLSFARQSWRYLIDGAFDAVVINKPYDFPLAWWLRRQGYRGVIGYNSGGTEFYFGDRFFARAIDIWFPCSEYNAKLVAGHYACEPAIIYNGVDPQRFTPQATSAGVRERFGVPASALLIVSTGRLIGWKGLATIVDALPGLADAHYLIVGGGRERERLEAQARQLGVAERVHFAGEVAHADLPALLVGCDVYVQPSIGEEAFGISVVEAMSCGLPVCASRQGGLVEVVADDVSGLLLPAGDVAAWRDALARLAAAPALRKRLGDAGRARVIEHFTWTGNARKLLDLIETRRNFAARACA